MGWGKLSKGETHKREARAPGICGPTPSTWDRGRTGGGQGASRAFPSGPHTPSCCISSTERCIPSSLAIWLVVCVGTWGWEGGFHESQRTGVAQLNLNNFLKAPENAHLPTMSLPVLTNMSLPLRLVGTVFSRQVTPSRRRWSGVLSGSYVRLQLMNKREHKAITT